MTMILPKDSLPLPTTSRWRSLCDIASPAEAVMHSARCRFSLETTEVLGYPPNILSALVEQELPGVWRWAVYGTEDTPLAEGSACSQPEAKEAALRHADGIAAILQDERMASEAIRLHLL